jgi:hypothetical protein
VEPHRAAAGDMICSPSRRRPACLQIVVSGRQPDNSRFPDRAANFGCTDTPLTEVEAVGCSSPWFARLNAQKDAHARVLAYTRVMSIEKSLTPPLGRMDVYPYEPASEYSPRVANTHSP